LPSANSSTSYTPNNLTSGSPTSARDPTSSAILYRVSRGPTLA
jgi:hypothetical protein